MRPQRYTHTSVPLELSSDSGRMVTEYQARFFAHSPTAVQKLRKPPENCGRLERKMAAFRSDSISYDVTRRVPKVTKVHHVQPEGSVMHTSTYVHDYKAYSTQQNIVNKTTEHSPLSTKTDVRSTYKEEFQSRDTSLERPARTNSNLKLSYNNFDTTVLLLEHCCPKAPTAARKSWKVSSAGEKALPFESMTSYKLHYICHPPQPKQLIQQLVYKPSSSPLSCVTTYRHDYRCLQVDVAKPIRCKATWESNPTPCQGFTKLWDKCKTWPLRLTRSHRTVVDSTPKEFISTTHTDVVAQQCQALPSIPTPKQAWTTDKVSSEALSIKGEKHQSLEAKKVLPITQVKELDKLVGVSKNTSTCPSQHMPKTQVLTSSLQHNRHLMPGNMAFTASDITKEIQPRSERVYKAARADGNKLQFTQSARVSGPASADETNSNKPQLSHSPKTQTIQSAALTTGKKVK